MLSEPIYPTVTLGGTSAQALLDQYQAVVDQARVLLETMQDASPQGRDYLAPINAHTLAQEQFRGWFIQVMGVYEHFGALAEFMLDKV